MTIDKILAVGKHVIVKKIDEETKVDGKFIKAEGARKNDPIKVQNVNDNGGLKAGDIMFIEPYGYYEVGEYLVVPGELVLCKVDYKEE